MSGSGPAGARGREPRLAPNTPTRRRPWWSPSTVAGGAARSAATPTAVSPRCGPANWAAPRSSSATTSASSATCPDDPTRWPASCGAVSGERCCGAPPMTPIPTERVVVANADQLLIVVALADPPPRTGFVERALIAAYAGGLEPILCLTKTDLAPPEPFAAQFADLDLTDHHRGPRRSARRRRAAAGRQGDRAARPFRGRQVDAGESPCAGGGPGDRRGDRRRQGQAHVDPVGGAAADASAAG